MTVANRIKVVLLDSGEITQFGLGRVAEFASEVVVVGERRRSHVVEQLQALGVNVTVEEGKADIDSAILAAARSGAVVVVTGRPAKAEAFVKRAAHGAANAVDHGLPVVGVYVLGEHETRPGKVFTVTETGEMSGYEALFAAALAEQLGREVVAVSPPGRIRAARTVSEHPALGGAENLHQRAHEIAAGAGVKWTERSDPSPVNFVTEESGSAAVIIIGVLDVPAGSKWLGSRPKVNEGNPRAAASLVGGAERRHGGLRRRPTDPRKPVEGSGRGNPRPRPGRDGCGRGRSYTRQRHAGTRHQVDHPAGSHLPRRHRQFGQ